MTDFNNHPQPRTFAPSKEVRARPSPRRQPPPVLTPPLVPRRMSFRTCSTSSVLPCPQKRHAPRLLRPRPARRALTFSRPLTCAAQGLQRAPRHDLCAEYEPKQPRTLLTSTLCLCADHFPDAYAGQNTKIRDTLNNLILKSPQNWQTSVGLPFFQIEGTVVEWDEVKFDGMPLAACARGHERLLTPAPLALRSPPDATGSV